MTMYTITALLHEAWSHVIGYEINGDEMLGVDTVIAFIKDKESQFTNAHIDSYGHIRVDFEDTIPYKETKNAINKRNKLRLLGKPICENIIYEYNNGQVHAVKITKKMPPFLLYHKGIKTTSMCNCFKSYFTELELALSSIDEYENLSALFSKFDLELLDTHNIEDMRDVFFNNTLFQELKIYTWDVSHVTDMDSMFALCDSLKKLDLSNWDVSNVTDISGMFYGCKSLKKLNLSNWDVSNVTYMDRMFYYCESLENSNISGWNFNYSELFDSE